MEASRDDADRVALPSQRSPRRGLLTIDLGSTLRSLLDDRAKAERSRVSDLVRLAVREHLTGSRASGEIRIDDSTEEGVYRPSLSRRDSAKLDQLKARTGRRTRQGVLRALLDGVELAPSIAQGGDVHLGEAMQQLVRSNAELVSIGRDLNKIARSLNLYPGPTTVADRLAFERAAAVVFDHLETASRLAAQIRPLVRLPDEPRQAPRGRVLRKPNKASA
jgi:hypothetical protein